MGTEAILTMRIVTEVIRGTFEELWSKAVTGAEIEFDGRATLAGCRALCQEKRPGATDICCCYSQESGDIVWVKKGADGLSTLVRIGHPHVCLSFMNTPVGPVILQHGRVVLIVVKPEGAEKGGATVTGTIDGEAAVRHLADPAHHTRNVDLMPAIGVVS